MLIDSCFKLCFPGTNFTLFYPKIRVSRYDGKPLTSQELTYLAQVKVTQRKSSTDPEPVTMSVNLPVLQDGNVYLLFRVHEQVDLLDIRVSIFIYSIWVVGPWGIKNIFFDIKQLCYM